MADEGATTVGSIVGHLKIDASEWNRDIDAAKAKAHELGTESPKVSIDTNAAEARTALETVAVEADKIGGKSPNIRVDTNAATATAALEGTTAGTATLAVATARLEAAERAAANASSTAYVAQLRLKDLQEKGAATALQLAVAEEAVARADRNAEAAEAKHAATTAALSAAQSAAAAASLEDSTATDQDTQSAKANAQANNQRISGLQVLLGLAPAILAAAAPIGAAAIGLGAAFGVMALSGVAAVKGIKDAMAVGDQVGNQYATGLTEIKDNLNQLAATAANSMLSAFNGVVGDINQNMPFLNQTVGVFSALLGQMGGTALHGVLSGLQAMNPLLIQGGAELAKFVSWLTSFTSTNGFTEFVNYAINSLPSVMALIENLVTTAGHILAAFAPLGPTVIGILNGISTALNALPLPVLAGLVTSAVLIGPAFTLAKLAVATFGETAALSALQVSAFGVAINLAVPVVGILLAAVAGIGMAFAASAAGSKTATDSVATYTSQLEQTNGVIDESIQKSIAKALVDNGAAAAAKDLGIGTSQLTGYVTGNADAQTTLAGRIKAAKDAYNNAGVVVGEYGNVTSLATKAQTDQYDAAVKLEDGLKSQKGAIDQSKAATELYKGMLDGTTSATSANGAAVQDMAARYGMTVDEYNKAKDAQQQTATQLQQTTDNMRVQGDVAGLLKMALDNLNGKTIGAAQAQNQFDSQLANMSKHMDATGKTINRADTDLQGMTASAVKNRGELIGLVTAAQTNAEAFRNQGNSAEATSAKLNEMKQQIIDNAVAHGEARDQVEALVNSLFKIPPVEKSTVEVETDNANAKIAAVKALLASTNGTRAQAYIDLITVRSQTDAPGASGSSVGGRANGSLAGGMATGGVVPQYFADGGVPGGPRGTDTVPTWLTPGEFVVNRDASARNRPLLEAINAGATPGGQAPVTVTHYHTWYITGQRDPVATAHETSRRFTSLKV